MSWELEGRPLRRILVSRLRYLGDIAMSTVVLEVLRRGDTELCLDYLCEEVHAPLLREHPDLRTVFRLAARRRNADARARRPATAAVGGEGDRGHWPPPHGTAGTALALRRARHDLALDLFFNPRSAWLLRCGGAPLRIGGAARRWRRRLYTHTVEAAAVEDRPGFRALAPGGMGEHLVRLAPLVHRPTGLSFLDWCEAEIAVGSLRPRVAVPPLVAGGEAEGALAEIDVDPGGGFALLAPGATWPTKEWPVEHWRSLLPRLRERTIAPPVMLCPPGGAGAYAPLRAALADAGGGLLPPLTLSTALVLVGAASMVVSVDGGVMHAAVAMGRPTVALFGPTSPEIWFPYEGLGPYRVLATRPACHPCDRHDCGEFICLPELLPDAVAAAAGELPAAMTGGKESA